MKFDFMRVIQAISMAVAIAEKIKGAGGGKEKLKAANDASDDMIAALEVGIGKDILNNAEVQATKQGVINAVVAFSNAVEHAKKIKNPPSES